MHTPWVTLLRRPAHSGWLQAVVTGIGLQQQQSGRALDNSSSGEAGSVCKTQSWTFWQPFGCQDQSGSTGTYSPVKTV